MNRLPDNLSAACLSLAFFSLAFSPTASADVSLPTFFSDHMVLQQQTPIRIWGWAEAGEGVSVSIGEQSASATADQNGRWKVELPAMPASKQALTVSVKGKNTVEIKDVLIGEVWLCSGQSNMEWTVGSSTNADGEIAVADYPMIRHMKVPRVPNTTPQNDLKTEWEVCTPATAGRFTACGYFMARKLYRELDVPIGLVNSSWGGTRIEPWTAPVGFEKVEAIQDIYQSVIGRTPGTQKYNDRLSAYISDTENWLSQAKGSLTNSEPLAPAPAYPAELTPFNSHQDPTMLYNSMIHPLVGFRIRGAIWYQGESNHTEGLLYFEKKKALINGWRELWGQGDFPFYYVQIAPFQYGTEDPTILAGFWESQAAVQELPNTGMVVINDIATLNDIHPPNKQDVGLRLANLALKYDYGRDDLVANSPELDSVEVLEGQLRVTFKNTGGGLKTRDGKPPTHFEVIGAGSGGFQPATAKIDGDSVVLSSADVAAPVAFRFAWHKLAEPNLSGATGLPVGAMRGGEVPDFLNILPIGKDYSLVYDLDLSKLGADIRYEVDNSDSVEAFDRIGYLLELSDGGSDEKLFVAMDPFTTDAKKIGVPTVASGANFQQPVTALDVYSTTSAVTTGTGLTGNIEFWPSNYGPQNTSGVTGASAQVYDFGDSAVPPAVGYGSMQVHNGAAQQTLFAINNWKAATIADVGIGNSTGETRDWTFTGNAGSYSAKRLRVYVRAKSKG